MLDEREKLLKESAGPKQDVAPGGDPSQPDSSSGAPSGGGGFFASLFGSPTKTKTTEAQAGQGYKNLNNDEEIDFEIVN